VTLLDEPRGEPAADIPGCARDKNPHLRIVSWAARIARERNLPRDRVDQLIRDHTANRALGFLGEPTVNVLQLNLDLDRIAPLQP
jgi:K+-transporting ATPase ATPase C chain